MNAFELFKFGGDSISMPRLLSVDFSGDLNSVVQYVRGIFAKIASC